MHALDSDLLTKIYQRSFRYGTNEYFSTRMAELPVIPSNLGVSLLETYAYGSVSTTLAFKAFRFYSFFE